MIKRYGFKTVTNIRDLGGYWIDSESITKWNTFLRADGITSLSEDEKQLLVNHGLKKVIDLRSAYELKMLPNSFLHHSEVSVINIPTKMVESNLDLMNADYNMSLEDGYIKMIDEKDFVYQVFSELEKTEGMTLFHCTAGKDRTGTIAFLLLKLMGVQRVDIINDYQQTYINLKSKFVDNVFNMPDHLLHLAYSKPETIEIAIDYFDNKYPDVNQYFLETGLSQQQIDSLKQKFTQTI